MLHYLFIVRLTARRLPAGYCLGVARKNRSQTTSDSPVSHHLLGSKRLLTFCGRYSFHDARSAFKATRAGKGEDGKVLVKAMISGPDVTVESV